MNKIHLHSILLTLAVLCLGAMSAGAQAVKTISVSNDRSYTDHVSLAQDSRDMDVMIKFMFDEGKNTLTVSVVSYRSLFVFREDARYGSVVRCTRLCPEQLPYVAESPDGARFTLSKALKKAVPPPRKQYIFKRWIEYEGLQPTPSQYKMVNDYIEQSFDILGKRNAVTVTLRDLFLLDPVENKPDSYILSRGRDLNTKYQIAIVRNPCLGLEEEVAAAQKLCQDIQKAYNGFRKNYPNGEAATAEALKDFNNTKKVLLTQYPAKDAQSPCPDLQDALQQYNHYVDSIGMLNCILRQNDEAAWDDGKPLDTKLLYTQTRQLDKAVARWLVSKDELERKDLVTQCQDIIQDVTAMIRQHQVTTAEEKQAVQAYNQAEQYFRKTCKQ